MNVPHIDSIVVFYYFSRTSLVDQNSMRLTLIESPFKTVVTLLRLSEAPLHRGCLREENTGIRVVYLAPWII